MPPEHDDEDEHDEDFNIENLETIEEEPDETDAEEGAANEPDEGEDPPEDDDELEISFGDDATPPARSEDSPVIRKLREENRRLAREASELRKANAPPPVELGPRPTLESCEYDEEKFAADHEAWLGKKAAADVEAQKQRQQQETAAQAWQEELAGFERKKTALKARNFDQAEAEVVSGLSQVQQAIIIQAADNSAQVIYALGMHPGKLADLAKITNPVKFTAAIVKLEGSLKVTSRRQAPTPDRPVRGAAPFSASNGKADAHLERLEREAAKSGDRSKIHAYRQELRAKEAARSK